MFTLDFALWDNMENPPFLQIWAPPWIHNILKSDIIVSRKLLEHIFNALNIIHQEWIAFNSVLLAIVSGLATSLQWSVYKFVWDDPENFKSLDYNKGCY